MPISLPPLSRRDFLSGSAAAVAALALGRTARGRFVAPDHHRFALFSDTHIAGDPAMVSRKVNMTDQFVQAAREVLQSESQPAAVLVCGDCAYNEGLADDYRQLYKLIQPLREAGLPVHCALGNHDHRERFWEIVEQGHHEASPLMQRHVTVIESPHANWFLLDSLDETNKTPGVLGEEQLAWLATALDQHSGKPALVMVHHNPDESEKPTGLVETRKLLDLLTARAHVKVLFYGHSHHWALAKEKELHLVNLPPVAYLFREGDPSGWVSASVAADGLQLTMHCIDHQHPQHGKQVEMTW